MLTVHLAGTFVIADMVFAATAAVLHPITGYFVAHAAGWPLFDGWLGPSLVLFLLVGVLWLPVVVIQMGMRDLARQAAEAAAALPEAYFRLCRIWFAFGLPAFFSVLGILWLMLLKPVLSVPDRRDCSYRHGSHAHSCSFKLGVLRIGSRMKEN